MKRKWIILFSLIIFIAGIVFFSTVHARSTVVVLDPQVSEIHPQFPLLDAQGKNVVESGQPVSTYQTCGTCHNTEFISTHSGHSDLGLSTFGGAEGTYAHPWDQSNGLYGQWNPITYRYLSMDGDDRIDLDTAEWIREFAGRIVGGGPAEYSTTGQPLTESNSENWDWNQSGVVEMNCFLCHLSNPNNDARIESLQAGEFQWANTATLVGTGLVEGSIDQFTWNPEAFSENGNILAELITIQDPSNENCAQCHGDVHASQLPINLSDCNLDEESQLNWLAVTTGQVITAQEISESETNRTEKDTPARPYDIHAARGLQCTDCHYSLNNPAYYQSGVKPDYLENDPRRLEISEYLMKPDHNLANNGSAANAVISGATDGCESCHDANNTHDWLPYTEQHMESLSCESCHIPTIVSSALQSLDWTVLNSDRQPTASYRGVSESSEATGDVVTGFSPILLPRENADGSVKLAPYNLVTSWYWVYESEQGPRPVRQEDLEAAWFKDGDYAPEILAVLDADANKTLSEQELYLDTPEKQAVVAGRLAALGLKNLHIQGEIQPYAINHNVVNGEWAIKDCSSCHSEDSQVIQPNKLSIFVPGGVIPEFINTSRTVANDLVYIENGELFYRLDTTEHGFYLFGHDRVLWVDQIGGLIFIAAMGAIFIHGGLRIYSARKNPHPKVVLTKVHMYGVYARFWHWLHALAILFLLFTGLMIHQPALFSAFKYYSVIILIHNTIGVLLALNAALSVFYHVVSGEIRQYIPHPYGFFDSAIVQTKYYLNGIFKGKEHPFEKTPRKRFNPIQQLTYFLVLYVLLPLQIISGLMMLSVQQWPQIGDWLGGLNYLAPFHSMVAWLFATFLIAHIYLATTGATPLTAYQAMISGWEDLEVHPDEGQPEEQHG